MAKLDGYTREREQEQDEAGQQLRYHLAAAHTSLLAALKAGDKYDLRNDAADRLQQAARAVSELRRFMGS